MLQCIDSLDENLLQGALELRTRATVHHNKLKEVDVNWTEHRRGDMKMAVYQPASSKS